MKVPIIDVRGRNGALAAEIGEAVARIVADGDYILGSAVLAFEASIRERLQVSHAAGLNSGTDALFLTLKAMGVGPGYEVITVPNTFVATVAAARNTGAAVRLVDVDRDENIDPAAFAAGITPRTRAVIAVHLRGKPARMQELKAIAEPHGIAVLEDASQAFGATLDGLPVGTLGLAGCFSLHPQKILGACGDAGLFTSNDPALADRIRLLRNHGLQDRDNVALWGLNSRLDSLQAAILSLKLSGIDATINSHRRTSHKYNEALKGLPLELPQERPGERCVYYHYSVMADDRDRLLASLQNAGVDARIHYPLLIHQQLAAVDELLFTDGLSEAERQAKRQLSLPIFDGITDEQIDYVVANVRRHFGAR